MDAQSLPLETASFDVVMLFEAIYYLPNPELFLREARRVLRPDGLLLICSANCERADFNASPFSHRYFSARDLGSLLSREGFDPHDLRRFSDQAAGLDRPRASCRSHGGGETAVDSQNHEVEGAAQTAVFRQIARVA